MQRIYESASYVHVWLGEAMDDSDLAMDLIEAVGLTSDFDDVRKLPWFTRAWAALPSVLQYPWWTRVWIIQELAMAKDVSLICGSRVLSWEHFVHFHNQTVGLSPAKNNIYQLMVLRLSIQAGNRKSLAFLLGPGIGDGDFQATDPRDMVYSLLGMSREGDQKLLPDYARPVHEVYAQAVRHIISTHNTLNIILLERPKGGCRLPSWCPDFSASTTSSTARGLDDLDIELDENQASAGSIAKYHFSDDGDTLSVQGRLIDSLVLVRPFPYEWDVGQANDVNWPRLVSSLRNLEFSVLQALKKAQPSLRDHACTEQISTLWRVLLIGDRILEPEGVPEWGATGDPKTFIIPQLDENRLGRLWETLQGRAAVPEEFQPEESEPKRTISYMLPVIQALKQGSSFPSGTRYFFVTSQGFMGMGRQSIVLGDNLCLLAGCDQPVILRRTTEHYEFVGGTYVRSIMAGELILNPVLDRGRAVQYAAASLPDEELSQTSHSGLNYESDDRFQKNLWRLDSTSLLQAGLDRPWYVDPGSEKYLKAFPEQFAIR
ncbi:hypothetical protein W97_09354 [Coniosporium apollinis CBS 100218]|uniref:Heterokaryon incompatibility domain-containing protein n=1 Tax=Coniosporium apollinis (strain CBS 100218) TaxID=1168221 RepID=R7Z7M0_CONA1|nr:uncharacterized protein W97_09354 [Coniosporium apollinis CBS 100218]EON70088.1 hypothetical protein W97_09354 [Coniosporium apollinis CBS 100218]